MVEGVWVLAIEDGGAGTLTLLNGRALGTDGMAFYDGEYEAKDGILTARLRKKSFSFVGDRLKLSRKPETKLVALLNGKRGRGFISAPHDFDRSLPVELVWQSEFSPVRPTRSLNSKA
jgi:hypothetical protein